MPRPALAVVQARMSSTRLPGKSLADVSGEPMLALMLRRLAPARELAEAVVATSDGSDDDPIEEAASALGHRVHRGSLDDVLDRFVGAASGHDGPVVRVTADCPFVEPSLVDAAVRLFLTTPGCAYAGNVERRTYPDGLDVEVIDSQALRTVARESTKPADREHVTLAIRRNPDRFPAAPLVMEPDLSVLRWTVDTADDLEFVRRVVARLGQRRYHARMGEVLAAVRAPPSLATYRGLRG